MRRVRAHIQGNVVGYVALFISLSGAAYAATSLPARSVGTKQLRTGAVTTSKLAKGAVTAAKIAPNSLTGAQVNAGTLGTVPNAAHAQNADAATNAQHATSADSASTAGNATQLAGVAASGYQRSCADGAIKGYVLVHGSASFPSTYTSDPSRVSSAYNCGGGVVQAKRNSAGNYQVQFVGNPSSLALGQQTLSFYVGFVEVESAGSPGEFQVYDSTGSGGNADTGFILALL